MQARIREKLARKSHYCTGAVFFGTIVGSVSALCQRDRQRACPISAYMQTADWHCVGSAAILTVSTARLRCGFRELGTHLVNGCSEFGHAEAIWRGIHKFEQRWMIGAHELTYPHRSSRPEFCMHRCPFGCKLRHLQARRVPWKTAFHTCMSHGWSIGWLQTVNSPVHSCPRAIRWH